jgi:hypothetical protein
MSSVAKQRLLRVLLDLREESAKCLRACDNDRNPESAGSAHYRGTAEGIDFAVDEITAALRIDAEETWTSDLDQATANVWEGGAR